MGLWADGENDRDHHEDVYGEGGEPLHTVPCVVCRGPVRVSARTDSIFATHTCERCHQRVMQTQAQKAERGAA